MSPPDPPSTSSSSAVSSTVVLGGACLLLAVGLLAWALGAMVTRPLGRLIEQTERVRRGRDLRVAIGPETLGSVLSNLVDNARRHGGEGVRVVPSSEMESELLGDGWVRILVVDDGPGISEANLPRIFDRFFTSRRDEGGSGLGLSIVRSLVEAHRGRIEVRSVSGETIFALELPLAEESLAPEPGESPESGRS